MAGLRGVLTLGSVTMELPSYRVTVDGGEVALQRPEAELLRLLLRERGRCVPRRQLVVAITAVGSGAAELDERIHLLRDAVDGGARVVTVGGVGYRLEVTSVRPATP